MVRLPGRRSSESPAGTGGGPPTPWVPVPFEEGRRFYPDTPDLTSRIGKDRTGRFVHYWDLDHDPETVPGRRWVAVRGLFGSWMPGNFRGTLADLNRRDRRAELAPVRTHAPVVENAGRLVGFLGERDPAERFVFLAHSKGGLDTLEALRGRPDLADRTDGVLLVQPPVGGSPVLDSILHRDHASTLGLRTGLREGLHRGLIRLTGSWAGCESVTTRGGAAIRERLMDRAWPFPILNVVTWSRLPTVWLDAFHDRLSQIAPGRAHDGQVFVEDQVWPGADVVLLGHLDHAQPVMGNGGFDAGRFWRALLGCLGEIRRESSPGPTAPSASSPGASPPAGGA